MKNYYNLFSFDFDSRYFNKVKTIKYTTENLICFLTKDLKGKKYYQIWEKKSKDKPSVIYIDKKHKLRLNNEKIPIPETDYIYYDEMCDVIQFLNYIEG